MPDLASFQHDFLATLDAAGTTPLALAVYRNTIASGAVAALGANHPVCQALVGEEMFAAAATDFAAAHPPRSPVLADYGEAFAEWIEEQPWARDVPYLADVAMLERLHVEALFAADAPALGLDDLAGIAPDDWQDLGLTLHPAARFAWTASPAMAIWLAHREGPPGELAIEWTAQGALFTRPGLHVRGEVLDAAAHRFVFGVARGETAGKAALATAALHPGAEIGAIFARLLGNGTFAPSPRQQRT